MNHPPPAPTLPPRLEPLEARRLMDGDSPFEPDLIASRGGLPLVIADFNGDSRPDLLMQRGRRLELRLNDGRGGFGDPDAAVVLPFLLPRGLDAHGRVAAGRFTSGDELDLAIATGVGPAAALRLLKNDGAGSFRACPPEPIALARGRSATVRTALFRGPDDKASLLVSDHTVLREIRFGDLGRVRAERVLMQGRGRIDAFDAADANGDGLDDLAVSVSVEIPFTIQRRATLRTLLSERVDGVPRLAASQVVGRFDGVIDQLALRHAAGDDRADIVHTLRNPLTWSIHLHPAGPGPDAPFDLPRRLVEFPASDQTSGFRRLTLIGVGDFSGDGIPDVAYDDVSVYPARLSPWTASPTMLEGLNDGTFTPVGIPGPTSGYEYYATNRGFAYVDALGDGRPDLLSLTTSGELVLERFYPSDWTRPPTIGSLTVGPIALPPGLRTISAADVLDPDGTVCGVRFWFDAGDGVPRESMTDLDGSDGWSVSLRPDAAYGPPGVKRFWAQAWDEFGFFSDAVLVEVTFS